MDKLLKCYYDYKLFRPGRRTFEELSAEEKAALRSTFGYKFFECVAKAVSMEHLSFLARRINQSLFNGAELNQTELDHAIREIASTLKVSFDAQVTPPADGVKSLEELVEEARDKLPYTSDYEYEWFHFPVQSPPVKPYYNPYELFPIRAVSPIILRFRKQRINGIVTGWEFVEAAQAISRY